MATVLVMVSDNKNTLLARCFITSNSRAPSFLFGLVKIESDFVRSVETDLGRWALVVYVISFDIMVFWLLQT